MSEKIENDIVYFLFPIEFINKIIHNILDITCYSSL